MRPLHLLLIAILAPLLSATVVSAVTVFLPSQGGTGTGATPQYGQVLMGNSSGVYTPTATSSLGLSFSTTSADAWFTTKSVSGFSTTSADFWQTQRNFHSTTSFAYNLSTYDLGSFFSTTSVNYWESTQSRWATTSASYWYSISRDWYIDSNGDLTPTTTIDVVFPANISIDTGNSLLLKGIGDTNWRIFSDSDNNINFFMSGSPGASNGRSRSFCFGNNDSGGDCNVQIEGLTGSTSIMSRLDVPYASTTALTIFGSLWGANLSGCNGASNALTWSGGQFGCNTIEDGTFSTTSANYWSSLGLAFSTTSANFWETQQAARGADGTFSTTSANYWSSVGLGFSTTSANAWRSVGLSFSTTSSDYWKTQNNFFSTTSASYFSSLGLAHSTTSVAFQLLNTIESEHLGDDDWGDITITSNVAAVEDDSHAHTATTISGLGTADISGLDISDDTNLTGGAGLTLTGDDMACDTASGSVFGCLLAADWTRHEGKVSTSSIDTIGEVETLWGAINVLTETEIDGCSELLALLDDETGTCGGAVFSVSPTLTGTLTFANATGTQATTTFFTTTIASTSQLTVSNARSALGLLGSTGLLGAYAGASCTNQAPTAQSAVGGWTCSSINNAWWSGTDLSVANGGTGLSTFGGTNHVLYTTATDTLSSEAAFVYDSARNKLTADYASSTAQTISSVLYLPNSYFDSTRIGLGSTTPSALWGISMSTSTILMGAQFANSIASSTTASATETVNWDRGNTQRYILDEATAIVMNSTSSNPRDGGKYVLHLCQDVTGSRAVTWATANTHIRWPDNATTTITSTANKCTMIGFIYDATYSLYRAVGSTTNMNLR